MMAADIGCPYRRPVITALCQIAEKGFFPSQMDAAIDCPCRAGLRRKNYHRPSVAGVAIAARRACAGTSRTTLGRRYLRQTLNPLRLTPSEPAERVRDHCGGFTLRSARAGLALPPMACAKRSTHHRRTQRRAECSVRAAGRRFRDTRYLGDPCPQCACPQGCNLRAFEKRILKTKGKRLGGVGGLLRFYVARYSALTCDVLRVVVYVNSQPGHDEQLPDNSGHQ